MRIKRAIRRFSALVPVVVLAFNLSPKIAGQQPSHCAQNLFCLFNQEAAVSDSAGIHKYSENLIGLIVFNPAGEHSIRQLTSRLADRFANSEQAARAGNGKLVPEAAVAKAFNDLMQEVGALSSLRTDEAAIRRFREHAASIKAFPALFSADRNGTNCNPGEAIFLLSLLISDNGVLYERNVDTAKILMQSGQLQNGGGSSFGVGGMEGLGSSASSLLFSYTSHHNRNETIALFIHMADTLGL